MLERGRRAVHKRCRLLCETVSVAKPFRTGIRGECSPVHRMLTAVFGHENSLIIGRPSHGRVVRTLTSACVHSQNRSIRKARPWREGTRIAPRAAMRGHQAAAPDTPDQYRHQDADGASTCPSCASRIGTSRAERTSGPRHDIKACNGGTRNGGGSPGTAGGSPTQDRRVSILTTGKRASGYGLSPMAAPADAV